MQYRPPNVNQEFSNTNHSGSNSDSLGLLLASSECMTSAKKLDIMMYLNWISSALAENTLTKMDIANRAVIPPHLAPGRLIHFSADNILDGKHTIQNLAKRTFSCCYTEKYDTSKVCNVCSSWGHGHYSCIFHGSDTGVITELQFHNGIPVEWFNKTLPESYSCLKYQATYHAIFIQESGDSRT